MATRKRKMPRPGPKTEQPKHIKFPQTSLYILSNKIQKVRYNCMKKLATDKGFRVTDNLNSSVTHLVVEMDDFDEVMRALIKLNVDVNEILSHAEIVKTSWFVECMEENRPVKVKDEHKIFTEKRISTTKIEDTSCDKTELCSWTAKYACQRSTPLNHYNKNLTDNLEILEENAHFRGEASDSMRALAFRKASAVLKAYPHPVRCVEEVETLPDIKGKHCIQVVQDIIENGYSKEVRDIQENEWFNSVKELTSVFGCGPTTARKWYSMGLRSIEDLKNSKSLKFTPEQKKGIEFFKDLNSPVSREEAKVIRNIISSALDDLLPGATVVLTGGYIRGKESGHDVDLLISHPERGKEKGLLQNLVKYLDQRNLLEYTNFSQRSFNLASAQGTSKGNSTMDHHDQCLTIFRLQKTCSTPTRADKAHPCMMGWCGGGWVARRVDLVVSPADEYAYALLGWSGSRLFVRSIRLYAEREKQLHLSSHGLYDRAKDHFLPATTEKDIFDHLDLTYREPSKRNC